MTDIAGALVPNARISVEPASGEPQGPVSTDSRGEASLHLPAGSYNLRVNFFGFIPWSSKIEIQGKSILSVTARMNIDAYEGPVIVLEDESGPQVEHPAPAIFLPLRIAELPVQLRTAHNTRRERETRRQLEKLLEKHDLSRWAFAHEVIVDEGELPASRPVLTLSARPSVKDDDLLFTYLGLQMERYLLLHPKAAEAAEQDFTLYHAVNSDGASDETFRILACELADAALVSLPGRGRERAIQRQGSKTGRVCPVLISTRLACAGDDEHYSCGPSPGLPEEILKRHGLDDPDARIEDSLQ